MRLLPNPKAKVLSKRQRELQALYEARGEYHRRPDGPVESARARFLKAVRPIQDARRQHGRIRPRRVGR